MAEVARGSSGVIQCAGVVWFSVSYAGAFAIVTARDEQAVVVTGDPEFEAVAAAGVVAIEWLPR